MTTIVPKGGLVLVTGVNGFIGSHIALNLLKLGYQVRGTARAEEKAAWVKELASEKYPSAHLETIVVPDVLAPGAWEEAVKGVAGIVHVAGDMTFGPDPNEVVTPMLKSVRGLLEAAAAAANASVKRFVITSSNRAVYPPELGKHRTVDASTWNLAAVDAAWLPPPYENDRAWDVYSALKVQTEQEVWKFAREQKPGFVVNSVLPCYVVGPIVHPKQAGSTGRFLVALFQDPTQNQFLKEFGGSLFVDVEDTALLHVAGLTQEDVKGERLFGFAEGFTFNSLLAVLREIDPTKSWQDIPNQQEDLTKFDPKRELELLARFGKNGWARFSDSVKRTVLESNL